MKELTWPEAYGRMQVVGCRTATGGVRWRLPGAEGSGTLRFWHEAPDRWRVEDDKGVWHITDGRRQLVRANGRMEDMSSAGITFRQYHPKSLLGVPDWLRDFPTPRGPGKQTAVADRAAWEFAFLPLERKRPTKPHPLRVAVDDSTGTVLRMSIPEADYIIELTEFRPDAELPERIFTWDGPVSTRHDEERARTTRTQRWLNESDLPVPTWWPHGLGYHGLDGDPDTGAYRVLLEVPGHPELSRWPKGTPAPPRRDRRHVHRWQDERWEWALAVEHPLTEKELTRVIDSFG